MYTFSFITQKVLGIFTFSKNSEFSTLLSLGQWKWPLGGIGTLMPIPVANGDFSRPFFKDFLFLCTEYLEMDSLLQTKLNDIPQARLYHFSRPFFYDFLKKNMRKLKKKYTKVFVSWPFQFFWWFEKIATVKIQRFLCVLFLISAYYWPRKVVQPCLRNVIQLSL